MGLSRILGRVRGLYPNNSPENREDEEFHVTPCGDCLTSQGLSELTEIVRLGDSWQTMGVAFAALTAVPSTAGRLTLWNGEPGNGKVYVIDSVNIHKIIIDVTTNDVWTTYAQILRSPQSAPTNAAYAIASLSGKSNYAGRARTIATSTSIANYWDAIGTTCNSAPLIAGSAWESQEIVVFGKYIVTPGSAFTLNVAEVTNTASTFKACIRWHEVQIPYVN
jgi:hypothetical protein